MTGKWQGHQLWSWIAHVPTTDSSPAPPPSLLLPSSARTDRQCLPNGQQKPQPHESKPLLMCHIERFHMKIRVFGFF